MAAGVDRGNILLDPGLGFAKTRDENWRLLRGLPTLIDAGFPLLVGASRKRFLGQIRADRGLDVVPTDADAATHAVSAIAAHLGAWGVRVHDVAASRDAVEVAAAWKEEN